MQNQQSDREKLGLKPISKMSNQSQQQQSDQQQSLESSNGFQSNTNRMKLPGQNYRPQSPAQTGSLTSKKNLQQQGDQSSDSNANIQLQLFNIYNDEGQFSSQIKVDLLQLQEEINYLDIDGKLRNMSSSELIRQSILSIKKWISSYSILDIKKELDRRSTIQMNNIQLVLDQLKVKSPEEGIVKLFRMLLMFELMVIKLTEFEALFFIRYDESYSSLTKNHNCSNDKTQLLQASGINMSRFQVCFANLERAQNLYSILSKQKGSNQKEEQTHQENFQQLIHQHVSQQQQQNPDKQLKSAPQKKTEAGSSQYKSITSLRELQDFFESSSEEDCLNKEFMKHIKKIVKDSDVLIIKQRKLIDDLKSQLAKLEDEKYELTQESAKNSQKLKVFDSKQEQIKQLELQLQNQKEDSVQQQSNHKKMCEQLNQSILQIQKSYYDQTSQLQDKEKTINNLKKQIEDKNDDIQRIKDISQKQMSDICETKDKLEESLQQKNQDVLSLQEKLKELTNSTRSTSMSVSSTDSGRPQSAYQKQPPRYEDDPKYWLNLIDELKKQYDQRLCNFEDDYNKTKKELVNSKIQIEQLQQQIITLQDEIRSLEQANKDFIQKLKQTSSMKQKEIDDTYEVALKEEFDRMKRAYDKQIDTMKNEILQLKQNRCFEINDLRQKLEKETETKLLLLKKINIFIK